MITCLEKEMKEGGQVLTKVIVVAMITTGLDQGTKREDEEVTKKHHSRGRILVPGTVDQIETIDQPQQEDTTEALPEENLEETIQEEGITETIPQTEMINLDPKKDIDISNHHTIKEGLQVVPETVTMVEMGREKKEMGAKEETLIEV